MTYFIGTQKECELVQAAMTKTFGYPKRDGVHVGGGRHVVIPDEFYPGAPGWTERHSDVAGGKAGFALDLGGLEKVEDFKGLDKTQQAELTKLAAAIEAKAELPEGWHKESAKP